MIVFENEDILKAGFALAAGIILGLEREIKDKAAGIKTITIICLGACLFSILSERLGAPGNATTLAAYIVSGVGFIGAGTIFKEGPTISGLTTAGIIWLSAAVGTAIGFAQYATAIIFILASLVVIVSVWLFEKYFTPIRQKKKYRFVFTVASMETMNEVVQQLREQQINIEIRSLKKQNGQLSVTCDTIMDISKIDQFAQWALASSHVSELQV
jgi:putative Mg2+ transporter-C (MgtC) family protein